MRAIIHSMRSTRRRSGDQGAVLIVFAAFALVAVLFMAFVVDIGNMRQERREVTTSTDAAALAAAGSVDVKWLVINHPSSDVLQCSSVPTTEGAMVEDVVREYLTLNGGSAFETCEVHWDAGEVIGWVSVNASEVVEYAFNGVVGQDGGRVSGATAASFSATVIPASPFVPETPYIPPTPPTPGTPATPAYAGGGLRPIGLCFKEVQAVLGASLPTSTTDLEQGNGSHKSLTIELDKLQHSNACPKQRGNSGSGNIGFLDYDGGSNGNGGANCDDGTQCGWAKNGYYGVVAKLTEGDPGSDFTKHAAKWYEKLKDEGTIFLVPVFDYIEGNGANTKFRITHFVEVRLTGFSHAAKRFTFELRTAHPYSPTPPPTSDATPGSPATPGDPGHPGQEYDPGHPGSDQQVNRNADTRICSVDGSAGECPSS